ncbi:MAG: DUF87 domain-containing protein [Ignavibacterium sp.]|nr:DUF87 domain-containing protein [Ignavibacterium sp.]MDW8376492.1 ATP-binding protein [Ignavibacteriales bacterium]
MSEEERKKIEDNQKKLEEAYQILLPWWGDFKTQYPLEKKTLSEVEGYLNRVYLFPLTEITINNTVEDISKFINERYQTLLSSMYSAGLSIVTIIKGHKDKINVYLGFISEDGVTNDPKYFESIVNGVLPGEKIKYEENISLASLVENLPWGGIVTGIPSLKNEDEKQQFKLSSIIRSMYGREYVLVILSKPVSQKEMQNMLVQLLNFRDQCHELVKVSVGEEKGFGKSVSQNEQITKGNSSTKGHSVGGGIGCGIPIGPVIVGGGFSYSHNWSKTESESKTTGTTESTSEQNSLSLTIERQNGLALELEKISDHFIERIMQGFNTGFWETTVTFAAKDKVSCDILGGSFIGELSKPSDKLFPPRLYTGNLESKKIFLPLTDSNNPIFPKSLSSYLTSLELSQIGAPPKESLPGYEIKKMPPLALTDIKNEGDITLGAIADYGNTLECNITLSLADLNKHLFVCGLTGSGKTTTVKHILKSLTEKHSIPFLVLESAKRDYRQLLGDEIFKGKLNVFTIGDATVSPIRFNPFYIQAGVHPSVHIDYLKAIFNASFSLYGPMPHIIEKCLHNIYIKKGWNLTTGIHPYFVNSKNEYEIDNYNYSEHYYCFPTLSDLKEEVNNYVKSELEYKGELSDNIRTAIVARLESLCVGAKGLMFNTYDFYPIEKLLNKSTIFEMENLADDDDKAFFVGLMLVLLSEYRQKDNPAINPGRANKGLQHLLVIEEAHRLLKNVTTERTSEMLGNPKGKAVEVFCNVISEMRALGQGVIVVEQIPTKISPDVIKNSNTKIVHRLVSSDDQVLLAGSLGISDEDAIYLTRLKTGHALCHKEGMERPVECVVIDDVSSYAISDAKIFREMGKENIKPLHSFETYSLSFLLGKNGKELVVKYFNSFCTIDSDQLSALNVECKKEFKKILLKKNLQRQFSESLYPDFITLNILELLNRGLYSFSKKPPTGFKDILLSAIENSDQSNHKSLLQELKKIWGVEPKLFITEVVQELSLKILLKKKNEFTAEKVNSISASFFIIDNQQVVEEISQNIVKKIGDING